ncbi:MAG: beta-lactamase family protein [Acidimicrobiia bacterium]|nr:beta-lactamase family protein [Acidimicrobiia bacterium]
MRLCLQHTTGQDIESYITHRVLAPLGLADAIGFRPDPSTHKLNVIVADDGPRPLLLEAGTINTTQVRVATGAVSSAQALASLYDALLRLEPRHLGISGATLDRLLNERTERHFDPVLDRDCQFGLGFMVNLADHLCGPLGESSFGHTGLAGMTFAGADPDLGLAFACHINGMLDHQPATERRLQVTAELVEGITSVRLVHVGECLTSRPHETKDRVAARRSTLLPPLSGGRLVPAAQRSDCRTRPGPDCVVRQERRREGVWAFRALTTFRSGDWAVSKPQSVSGNTGRADRQASCNSPTVEPSIPDRNDEFGPVSRQRSADRDGTSQVDCVATGESVRLGEVARRPGNVGGEADGPDRRPELLPETQAEA